MNRKLSGLISTFAVIAAGTALNGDILINEVLASTTSSDTEFFELYNTGPSSVDLTGWTFAIYESDAGASYGTEDQLFTIGGFSISVGGYYTAANGLAATAFSFTPDETLADNFFENSSSTYVLRDAGANVVATFFLTDGGDGDAANIGGTPITADDEFGPDGTFLPAGFYRVGDGGSTLGLLEFSPIPAASATPGAANVPEPSTYALVLGALGLGFVLYRRRKS